MYDEDAKENYLTQVFSLEQSVRGYRNGSEVKNTRCSSRGPQSDS